MKVKSSMIDEIFEWKEVDDQGQFDVKFPNGKVFRYYDVPKGIYEKLINASSIGSFFDLYIKKAGYRFEEVTEVSDPKTELIQRLTSMIEDALKHMNDDELVQAMDKFDVIFKRVRARKNEKPG